VGRLSGGGDAPGAELVPGAQCLGEHTFEYALYPHAGNWEEARVWREAHAFATPLIAPQTDSHDGPLPPVGRFLEVSAPEFVLTAVKAAEPPLTGEPTEPMDVIVRGYNISARPLERVAVWLRNGTACSLANLNEDPIETLTVTEGRVVIPSVGPRKIVTLRWKTAG
jgi:alpha-mannosidase